MKNQMEIEALADRLTRKDPSERREAARLLAATGTPEAAAHLVAALDRELQDPFARSDVGSALVAGLAQLRDPISVPVLLATAMRFRHSTVQSQARRALSGLGPDSVEPLMQALRSPGAEATDLVFEALARIGGESAQAAFLTLLEDPDPALALHAAQALGRIGDPHGLDALMAASHREDAPLRAAAISALAALHSAAEAGGPPGSAETRGAGHRIFAALDDADPQVRLAAVAGIGALRSEAAAEALIPIARDSREDGRLRAIALRHLAGLRPALAQDTAFNTVRSHHPDLRKAAAELLGRSVSPRAMEALLDAFALEPVAEIARLQSFAFVRLASAFPEYLSEVYPELARRFGDALARILDPVADTYEDRLGDKRVLRSPDPQGLARPDWMFVRLTEPPHTRWDEDFSHAGDWAAKRVGDRARDRPYIPEDWNDLPDASVPDPAPRIFRLSVMHPAGLQVDAWNALLTYVYADDVTADVIADCRRRLGDKQGISYTTETASVRLAREARITVRPRFQGCRINPAEASFALEEDLHCAEFRLKPSSEAVALMHGAPLVGSVDFFFETLLIGQVTVWAMPQGAAGAAPPVHRSLRAYQSIFPSYSRKDSAIVDMLARAYRAMGMTFLRDVEALRSGERWHDRLMELIAEADIFQLYWSDAARQSPHVAEEWRRALHLARPAFIRPVYWQTPMTPPPDELKDLHFARVDAP